MSVIHGLKWRFLIFINNPVSKINYLRVKHAKLNKCRYKTNNDVIISLTSFPARLNTLDICLKSLLIQTVRPYKIIVYFGSDVSKNDLPDKLLEMEKQGISFYFDEHEDIKPHKKYFYAMKQYSDKTIVTVDDDVVYPRKMLERLLKAHYQNPDVICAGRVHRIMFDQDGRFLKYNKWMHQDDLIKTPSFRLVPIGIGGVLYPAGTIPVKAFDIDEIKKLCLNADDLWLKCASCSNGIRIKFVEWASRFLYTIESAQKVALCDTNVKENRNDFFWKNALEYFELEEKDFKD